MMVLCWFYGILWDLMDKLWTSPSMGKLTISKAMFKSYMFVDSEWIQFGMLGFLASQNESK